MLAALVLVTVTVRAVRAGAQDQQREPFRVEVEAINVLVSVHDEKSGKFVTDLSPQRLSNHRKGRSAGNNQLYAANELTSQHRARCGHQLERETEAGV